VCYTQAMKNTTSIKKSTNKPKQAKPNNYRFWLVLSCAGLVGLWYVFAILLFIGTDFLVKSFVLETSPDVYEIIISSWAVISVFVASALSLPFAVAVFRRLRIEAPLISSIAFFMAIVFGFNVFAAIVSLVYFEPTQVSIIMSASFIFSGLLYGFVVRPLKHKLSHTKFIIVSVGLAVTPVALYALWRLVNNSL